jgi:3-hydroxyisobutyrate dehydrogenase-like beta-hydroxyacid dehydrogenase
VTVWNRSSDKIKPLVDIGASKGATISDAIQASSCVLVCVDCYATFDSLLNDENIIPYLDGKTFVQFSAGTPTEARSSEAWLSRNGAGHLASVLYHGPKCKEMAEIIHANSYELGSLYGGASLNVYQ